jgi:hypothetical protein
MLSRIFGTAVALAVAIIVVKSLPDVARYLKLREM